MPKARVARESRVLDVAVPQGAPSWITRELIEHTLRVWNPYYGDSLTPDDAVNILTSVGRLVGVLTRS